jgi:hypothetical protein
MKTNRSLYDHLIAETRKRLEKAELLKSFSGASTVFKIVSRSRVEFGINKRLLIQNAIISYMYDHGPQGYRALFPEGLSFVDGFHHCGNAADEEQITDAEIENLVAEVRRVRKETAEFYQKHFIFRDDPPPDFLPI